MGPGVVEAGLCVRDDSAKIQIRPYAYLNYNGTPTSGYKGWATQWEALPLQPPDLSRREQARAHFRGGPDGLTY